MKKLILALLIGMQALANINLNGVELDPQTQQLLKQYDQLSEAVLELLPLEEMRKGINNNSFKPHPNLANTQNIQIPGPQGSIPLRVYTPKGQGPFPVFVTYHGGGWALGDLNIHNAFCQQIALQAGMVVVSVGYRLAPEHPFPQPLIDCYTATQWAATNQIQSYQGDPKRIAIGGDSAGGNLAAAVTLMARNKGTPTILFQVLIYPATNDAFDTLSYQKYGHGYFLTTNTMKRFWNYYVGQGQESQGRNPYASPLQASNFANLPPALIIVADFDPLHDEGVAYAEALRKAGVPVKILSYPTVHGFISLANQLTVGKEAVKDIADQLRSFFAEH